MFDISEEMKTWNVNGIFLREGIYRFHCYVEIDGTSVLCYMPSNCKLEKIISLAGRRVLLKKYDGPSDKFQYIVEAVQYGNTIVLLNLQFLNRIVENQLERRVFGFLGQRKQIKREVRVGSYKSDLFIAESNTYIEIKAILSWQSQAQYPIASSIRSLEQLKKIGELLEGKYNFCYFLFCLNPRVKEILIDKQSLYGIELLKCLDRGLILKAFSIGGSNSFEIKKEIPITIE